MFKFGVSCTVVVTEAVELWDHPKITAFYPSDAMLAWVVCIIYGPVSVSSQYSVETAERIELIFGMGASFLLSYTVLKGNLATFKK